MKFSKIIFAASVLGSMALGFYLSGRHTLALSVGVGAIGGGAIAIGATAQTYDKKLKSLIDSHQDELAKKEEKLNGIQKQLDTLQATYRDAIGMRDTALNSEKITFVEINRLKDLLKTEIKTREQLENRIEQLSNLKGGLETKIALLTQKQSELEEDIKDRDFELAEERNSFTSRLASEVERGVNKAKRNIISEEVDRDASMTKKAIELLEDYKAYVEDVTDMHFDLHERTSNVNTQASKVISNLSSAKNDAIAKLEEYNQKLELDNAAYKQQLAGEILTPEKAVGKFGWYYTIANSFIDYAFDEFQICLKYLGIDERKDCAVVGFGFSQSSNGEQLQTELTSRLNSWVKAKGIHSAIIKPSKLYPALEITFMKDAPKLDETSLYRSAEEFKKKILTSRVFLRLMGKPESGKTPTALCIAEWLCRDGLKEFNTGKGRVLPHTIIAACNPLKGISRKTNEDLDTFTVWSDGDSGLKGLINEYEFRRNPQNNEYKDNVGFIQLFDEYDNAVRKVKDKSLLTTLPEVLSDGGHANLGLIVLGQGGNVSKLKIQQEDVKLFTNIILDSVTMKSFLDKYGDLYYDGATLAEAVKTITELQKIADKKNEVITDTARKFRFCMMLDDRSPIFYRLPYFDQTDIDGLNYSQTLSEVDKLKGINKADKTLSNQKTNQTVETALEQHIDDDKTTNPACTKCGTISFNPHGKTGRWHCENPSCSRKTFTPKK